jgi:hypothetical protein
LLGFDDLVGLAVEDEAGAEAGAEEGVIVGVRDGLTNLDRDGVR